MKHATNSRAKQDTNLHGFSQQRSPLLRVRLLHAASQPQRPSRYNSTVPRGHRDNGGRSRRRRVQDVVLHDEHDVEDDRDLREEELCRIARQAGPVTCEPFRQPLTHSLRGGGLLVVVTLQTGVEHELREGEDAACTVEEGVLDCPACRRSARVVEPGLRYVLYDRDGELDVLEGVRLEGGGAVSCVCAEREEEGGGTNDVDPFPLPAGRCRNPN